jgi:cell division protein FtsA
MKNLICAIDIGSSKIKILVVRIEKEKLEAVLKVEEISEGVKKGIVVDPEKVSKILRNLISLINQKLKEKITSAFVNLGGAHLFSVPTHALISVSRADQTVSEEDVNRVLQEAKIISAGHNKEIFDTIVKEFILDGERGIKDPVGLKGTRLEVEALTLGCFSPYLENLKKSLLNCGLEVFELIPSPIACQKAVLTEKQKELGVCLLDIGAQTTSISVFEEGNLTFLSVLPIGSQEITNKIAIQMQIDPELAERLKIEFGSCYFKGKNKRERIEFEDEEPLVFYPRSLARIIREGYSTIFDLALKELKKISKDKKLPAGIVLTGGGAKISKVLELAKFKFKLNCKIGKPKGILNLEEDPSFSTLVGLVLSAFDLEEEKGEVRAGFFSKIKRFFRIFLP